MNQPRLQGRRHGIRRWSAAPVLALLAGAAIGHAGVIAEKATFAARVPVGTSAARALVLLEESGSTTAGLCRP